MGCRICLFAVRRHEVDELTDARLLRAGTFVFRNNQAG